jgi:hypothetical protein
VTPAGGADEAAALGEGMIHVEHIDIILPDAELERLSAAYQAMPELRVRVTFERFLERQVRVRRIVDAAMLDTHYGSNGRMVERLKHNAHPRRYDRHGANGGWR